MKKNCIAGLLCVMMAGSSIGCMQAAGASDLYKQAVPEAMTALSSAVVQLSASSGQAFVGTNPFSMDPSGYYHLYAYNAPLIGYTHMGYAWQSSPQDALGRAVAAINALPALKQTNIKPAGVAFWGLMSVSNDGTFTKKQYFLYEDALVVNDTAYSITSSQYDSLKRVMEAGASGESEMTIPYWFAYMNPSRVVSIECTDSKGTMKKMKADNVATAASYLQYVDVSAAKTYQPGSKNLDNMPFKAIYTFDNGVTYTMYVSDTAKRKGNVVFYVESSDMSYACEYTAGSYISNHVESTQGMIDGPANPMTM